MKQWLIAVLVVVLFAGVAVAGDVELNTPITSATLSLDKNGNEYIRLIITENRTTGSIKYTKSIPVMVFGDLVQEAKALKAGDTLHGVATLSEYQGRESYLLLGFAQ